MQAASTLATAHYPETLGKTYVSLIIALLLQTTFVKGPDNENVVLMDFRGADHWCASLLPHDLGLDKNLV